MCRFSNTNGLSQCNVKGRNCGFERPTHGQKIERWAFLRARRHSSKVRKRNKNVSTAFCAEVEERVALMAPATDQLSACDPGLHVSGRYVTRPDAGSIVYDWPGVTVAVAVKSAGGEGDAAAPESEVNFDMDGGGNLFSVLQDGRCVNCCVSACFHSYFGDSSL